MLRLNRELHSADLGMSLYVASQTMPPRSTKIQTLYCLNFDIIPLTFTWMQLVNHFLKM